MTCDSEPALRLVGIVVKKRENGVLMILERLAFQERHSFYRFQENL